MRACLGFGVFFLCSLSLRAAECPPDLSLQVKSGSYSSLARVDYLSIARSLSMRKADLRASQELSFNGGPLMPCVDAGSWESCSIPGDLSTEKRISTNSLLTKDDPPVEVPLVAISDRHESKCVAFNPKSKQFIVLRQYLITWKVSGTSNQVTTSTNSYEGYELVSASDF